MSLGVFLSPYLFKVSFKPSEVGEAATEEGISLTAGAFPGRCFNQEQWFTRAVYLPFTPYEP